MSYSQFVTIITSAFQCSDASESLKHVELAKLYFDMGNTILWNLTNKVCKSEEINYRTAEDFLKKALHLWIQLCEVQQKDPEVYFDPFGFCLLNQYQYGKRLNSYTVQLH